MSRMTTKDGGVGGGGGSARATFLATQLGNMSINKAKKAKGKADSPTYDPNIKIKQEPEEGKKILSKILSNIL